MVMQNERGQMLARPGEMGENTPFNNNVDKKVLIDLKTHERVMTGDNWLVFTCSVAACIAAPMDLTSLSVVWSNDGPRSLDTPMAAFTAVTKNNGSIHSCNNNGSIYSCKNNGSIHSRNNNIVQSIHSILDQFVSR